MTRRVRYHAMTSEGPTGVSALRLPGSFHMHAGRITTAIAVLASLSGCTDMPVARYNEVQQELLEVRESNRRLETQLADRDAAIRNLQEQIAVLRETGAPLDDLVVPVSIELDRLSGGYDKDGRPGDDGIVLYIRPMDKDGSVLKVAGTVHVKLYDLQNPPDRNLLAECRFDAQETRSLWFGRLMTNHFTIRCPFPHPPVHDRITAEVTFTDLLTGRPLHAQGVYTVKLPPAETSLQR